MWKTIFTESFPAKQTDREDYLQYKYTIKNNKYSNNKIKIKV